MARISFGILVVLLLPQAPSEDSPVKEAPKAAKPKEKILPWRTSLADGQAQAQRNRQPILVRASADSCHWCKKLEEEIATPEVQKELGRWTLVVLDVDKSPREA